MARPPSSGSGQLVFHPLYRQLPAWRVRWAPRGDVWHVCGEVVRSQHWFGAEISGPCALPWTDTAGGTCVSPALAPAQLRCSIPWQHLGLCLQGELLQIQSKKQLSLQQRDSGASSSSPCCVGFGEHLSLLGWGHRSCWEWVK